MLVISLLPAHRAALPCVRALELALSVDWAGEGSALERRGLPQEFVLENRLRCHSAERCTSPRRVPGRILREFVMVIVLAVFRVNAPHSLVRFGNPPATAQSSAQACPAPELPYSTARQHALCSSFQPARHHSHRCCCCSPLPAPRTARPVPIDRRESRLHVDPRLKARRGRLANHPQPPESSQRSVPPFRLSFGPLRFNLTIPPTLHS